MMYKVTDALLIVLAAQDTAFLLYGVHCGCCLLSPEWRFCNSVDCSLPGSSVHGISQATILEWLAISLSRESS